jgi:superfamily I DNA/RNA helicase
VALATEADFRDPRADHVSLLTLHAAKGLEFPVVFIVGLEEEILPLRWDGGGEEAEEERRLFYVGMTRAESHLLLSRAERRIWRGRPCSLSPSRFLNDIEAALTQHHRTRLPNKRTDDRQLKLL